MNDAPGIAALTAEVKARALALGFARVGIARADRLEPEGAQLRAYVEAGRHGQMGWLADTAEVRAEPREMVPDAASVIVVALPFARSDGARQAPELARIARYAQGRDYHNVVQRKLRKLEAWLRGLGHDARWSVDARPVLERAWAARAGVGFVGKNCCLIVPGLGSHVFLGTVITSATLDVDAPIAAGCGECARCLDACPTRAFVAPRELDARRCVSYLTIEHEGPIDESLREGVGEWLFGCDVCQDVCPYNGALEVGRLPRAVDARLTDPFAPDPQHDALDLGAVLTQDAEAHEAWTAATPLRRPGRARLARNAAIVLGNRGGRRHLPVLDERAARDEDATVREAAAWAAAAIRRRG
ncbi:MAG: tRNA epoxyqueuosine(34) reductase QueG [Myxococcales bacterium]|nr:tRNA epoxyqueuosine(34) reductase QueG [Myxococcales bacterium]